jgi:hypothetical protein
MQRRVSVEAELMYHLYVDCMPREDDVSPTDEQLKHMSVVACGKDPASILPFVTQVDTFYFSRFSVFCDLY